MFPLLMGAGILLSGLSQYKAGQAKAQEYQMERQQALYNAQMADMDARAAQQKVNFEQLRQLMESEQIMGTMRVQQAASGARTDVGTPLLIRAQQWAELELDNFLIGLEGRTQKTRYEQEAAFQRIQARYYSQAAKSAKKAGKLGAASTILGGFATMGAMGAFGGGGGTVAAPDSLTIARGPTGMGY